MRFCAISVFVFFLLIPFKAEAKVVLLIESYHATAEWVDQNVLGVKSALEPDVEVKVLYLDTKRKKPELYEAIFEEAWQAYKKLKPDLIILSEDIGLKFLGPRFADKSIPVIFKGINGNPRDYFADNRIPKNMTGIIERHHLVQNIRLVNQLVKMNKRKIGIFFDESPTSDAIIKSSLYGKDFMRLHRLEIEWAKLETFEEWQDAILSAADKYDALILETMYTFKSEKTGQVLKNYEDALKWAYHNSPIPIFGSTNFQVKDEGVIATRAINGFNHGKQAGQIARNVLNGINSIKNIAPFIDNHTKLYLNQKALERFKITPSQRLIDQAEFR